MNDFANQPVVLIVEQKLIVLLDQPPLALSVKDPGTDSILVEPKMKDCVIEFPRQCQWPEGVIDSLERA